MFNKWDTHLTPPAPIWGHKVVCLPCTERKQDPPLMPSRLSLCVSVCGLKRSRTASTASTVATSGAGKRRRAFSWQAVISDLASEDYPDSPRQGMLPDLLWLLRDKSKLFVWCTCLYVYGLLVRLCDDTYLWAHTETRILYADKMRKNECTSAHHHHGNPGRTSKSNVGMTTHTRTHLQLFCTSSLMSSTAELIKSRQSLTR